MLALLTLALQTGARIGELLTLRWEHCADGVMSFLETKNGKARMHGTRTRPNAERPPPSTVSVLTWSQTGHNGETTSAPPKRNYRISSEKYGGRHGARTRDLRVANAALSQLS